MSARSHRRFRTAIVAAVAVCALTACGGSDGGPTDEAAAAGPEAAAVPQPVPQGVADPAEIPEASGPADDSCDPTSSLAPTGPPPAPGSMPAGSTMAEIADRGRLIVGVDQNTYLFGYRDPDSGRIEGFDIDIARQMAEAILGDPNAIQFVVLTSAERIPAIQEGTVDMVVRTMTINCERWQEVNFSTVYYEAGQRVLVRTDSEFQSINQLGGEKVCAAKGSTSIRNVAQVGSKPIPVAVDDWSDCLVMLQQGQVAAVSTDDTILSGLAAQDPHTRLVGQRFTAEPYGIAIHQDATDLVRFVNAVLEEIRANGTWEQIHKRWLGAAGEATPDPPEASYRD